MEQRNLMLVSSFIFLIFMLNECEPAALQPKSKHFVLVHGSCHGAWSWYKLVELLESQGHRVTAMDLAASGIDSKQVNDVRSISDYFRPLMEFMASLADGEKVVLVGHSFGGLGISKSMESFPKKISVAIFVTALMPGPTLNVSTLTRESLGRQGPQLDSRFTYDEGPNNPPTTFIFGPTYLSKDVYQLSPKKDLTLATMLVRPIYLYREEDMSKEIVLTTRQYGSVRRVYIRPDQDKVTKPDVERWMIEKNPPERVEEIRGSDHMVMMSKPVELSMLLEVIAEKCS